MGTGELPKKQVAWLKRGHLSEVKTGSTAEARTHSWAGHERWRRVFPHGARRDVFCIGTVVPLLAAGDFLSALLRLWGVVERCSRHRELGTDGQSYSPGSCLFPGAARCARLLRRVAGIRPRVWPHGELERTEARTGRAQRRWNRVLFLFGMATVMERRTCTEELPESPQTKSRAGAWRAIRERRWYRTSLTSHQSVGAVFLARGRGPEPGSLEHSGFDALG
jgi:hypothetical protein